MRARSYSDVPVRAFPIGTKATLLDTEVEVLGWARWRTSDGYVYHEVTLRTADAERWTLELDEGHIIVYRELPGADLGNPESAPAGSRAQLDRKRFVWPACRVTLERFEGEYWKDLEVGDRVNSRSFYDGSTALNASRELGDSQWEWSQGVYLDPGDVEKAFGTQVERPHGPHPARPYPYSPFWRAMRWVFLAAAVVGMGGALATTSGQEVSLLNESVTLEETQGDSFVGLVDSESAQIVGLRINATNLNNTWAHSEVYLGPPPDENADPETFEPQILGRVVKEFGAYSGYEGGESWSEVDTAASEGFRIGKGTYAVWLTYEKDPSARADVSLQVAVVQGYTDATGLWVWSGLFFILFALMSVARVTYWHRVLVDAGLREEYDD